MARVGKADVIYVPRQVLSELEMSVFANGETGGKAEIYKMLYDRGVLLRSDGARGESRRHLCPAPGLKRAGNVRLRQWGDGRQGRDLQNALRSRRALEIGWRAWGKPTSSMSRARS